MPKVDKKPKLLKLKSSKNLKVNVDENLSSNVNIGLRNVAKWNYFKNELKHKSDDEFAAYLIKTLECFLLSEKVKTPKELKFFEEYECIKLPEKPRKVAVSDQPLSTNQKTHQIKSILESAPISETQKILVSKNNVCPKESASSLTIESTASKKRSAEVVVVIEEPLTRNEKLNQSHESEIASNLVPNISSEPQESITRNEAKCQNDSNKKSCFKKLKKLKQSTKKKTVNDCSETKSNAVIRNTSLPIENSVDVNSKSKSEKKSNICIECNLRHVDNTCPLYYPVKKIKDAISYDDWVKGDVFVHSNSVCDSEEELNFSKCSLPECLELKLIDSSHGYSVVARSLIPQFTEFGPLMGQNIKVQDIPDDSNMKGLWEVQTSDGKLKYLSTLNLNLSNWLSYIRPAPTSEARNITIVTHDSQLYFVTIKSISIGTELLYWTDCIAKVWSDKKMNKTNCGGCNLKFDHCFHYRLHCQIFHDPSRSLTVRKYHCKVCGAEVLGKQNIVKHAADLHKGKGAYQCPFCRKFFLRLNYLEMHKTYGCSANPQRSRPLCDFCGRKFCQPQKLKVHIKRMHGDISSILAEFQCMSCLRVLGSRAALQRHIKEVHNKNDRESIICQQCGKGFQNKSNLKIHMLTHSGIKPFRCSLTDCSSAFTTKQCLQLHYKKHHGLSEENMPTINRTVEYTFNAYAGGNTPDSRPNSPLSNIDSDNADSQFQSSNSPTPHVPDENNSNEITCVDSPSQYDNLNDSYVKKCEDIENNMSINYDNYNSYDSVNNSSVICKGSKKWISTEGHPYDNHDKYSNFSINPVDTEPDNDSESKPVYPYIQTESSNSNLLVEASISDDKTIDISHAPINFTISHDSEGVSSVAQAEECQRIPKSSPSPHHLSQINLSLHPESHSNSLDISVSSTYQCEISPPPSHYAAPYSLQLSPVDIVSVAQQSDHYLRKVDEISGDETENVVQNLCLSSKDRLQIDVLSYKPYSDNIEEKSSLLKQYDNRDNRMQFLKHYNSLDDRGNLLKYEGLDERPINIPDDRLNLFKQYDFDDRSPTLLKHYDVMEERSNLYKLYDSTTEDRGLINFEPLETMDMSRCSGMGHIYSNLQVSPPKYPRPLYGTNPSHSYSDVLRAVNLHSQSVDLTLSRPATSNIISSSPTYQSYPLSPTLPTYLTPRSALSPPYHPYSGYY